MLTFSTSVVDIVRLISSKSMLSLSEITTLLPEGNVSGELSTEEITKVCMESFLKSPNNH
jgi:hypothetical protein